MIAHEYELKTAQPSDVMSTVVAIESHAFGEHGMRPKSILLMAERPGVLFEILEMRQTAVGLFGTKHSAVPVGYVAYLIMPQTLALLRMAVLPAYQGRGLGTMMVSRLKETVMAWSPKKTFLVSSIPLTSHLIPGIKLLKEKCGFVPMGVEDDVLTLAWAPPAMTIEIIRPYEGGGEAGDWLIA